MNLYAYDYMNNKKYIVHILKSRLPKRRRIQIGEFEREIYETCIYFYKYGLFI
jgi:hypothetical protein